MTSSYSDNQIALNQLLISSDPPIESDIIERSQKSVTLDFSKNDKKTDRLDFDRGYLLID